VFQQLEREFLKYRYILGAVIFQVLLFVPRSKGQATPVLFDAGVALRPVVSDPFRKSEGVNARELPPLRFNKKLFIALSASVYGAAVADMHQTMHFRNYSWWYETDPLAKPIVRLPAPAYYATGLALATGVNWLSWKMGHSRRWHRLSPLPQVLSIVGNTYGFKSNCFSNH
jgi:hypothetical protein